MTECFVVTKLFKSVAKCDFKYYHNSRETRVFILVALARLSVSHWFNNIKTRVSGLLWHF